jgi:uncharacterized cupredoxin-like copper-binding protein
MKTKLVVCAVMLAAVGAAAAPAATESAKVAVTLKEFKVLAPASAKAGKVTFVVSNKGKLKHEFIVVKTNKAPGKLPVKGTKANLKGLSVRGEIASFKPGLTKRLTLKLRAGKYVLICNMPGHYRAGQYKAFRVS